MSRAKQPPQAGPAGGGVSIRIERRVLASLQAEEDDYRSMSDAARRALRESLRRFGPVIPPIVNEATGLVVDGRRKLELIRELGYTEIDVVVVNLPQIEQRALYLTLHNPATAGEFTSMVAALIEELASKLPDTLRELRLEALAIPELEIEQYAGDAIFEEFDFETAAVPQPVWAVLRTDKAQQAELDRIVAQARKKGIRCETTATATD